MIRARVRSLSVAQVNKRRELKMATTKKKPDVGDLFVHDEQSQHLHANVALFNFDGEEVTFGFGNRRFKDHSEVDIHSYIHLSVPHFVRLHRLMTDMMNKL